MGVDQIDSTSPFTGSSFVVLDFNLVWDVSGSDFTPSNTAFNVTVGGTVGASGSTKFEAFCGWDKKTGATTTFNIRPAYTPAPHTFSTAGSYLFTFNSGPAAVSVAAGSQLIMHGSIKMSADDPMDPSVMDFLRLGQSAGVPPDPQPDWGVMIVPDTADTPVSWNGTGGSGGNGNWSDPALWSSGDVPIHPTDHVLLDQAKPVSSNISLDMNASVADVQLDAPDGLDVNAGKALSLFGPNPSNLAGTFSNNGTLKLLNATSAMISGTATHTGTFSIDDGSTLFFTGGTNVLVSGSSITGAGGLAVTGGTVTLNGTSTHTGPTGVMGGTLVVGNADALGGGSPLVINGGVVLTNPGMGKAISVASVATNAGGQIDITDNSMVIRGSTVAAVQAELAKGYNAGHWNGPAGITSSAAAASSETSIGYASNASLNLTTFKGVDGLTTSDVLVKYTYAGDANLDGKVDIGDLGLLAGAWQQSGKFWFDGDFTYDGTVNIGDHGLLASNWQKGVGSGTLAMTFDQAMAQFAAFDGVVVPEPASLSLLAALGGLGVAGRRRRRRGDDTAVDRQV
jgi:autotransporter-associated beta strand protein